MTTNQALSQAGKLPRTKRQFIARCSTMNKIILKPYQRLVPISFTAIGTSYRLVFEMRFEEYHSDKKLMGRYSIVVVEQSNSATRIRPVIQIEDPRNSPL